MIDLIYFNIFCQDFESILTRLETYSYSRKVSLVI